MLTDDKRAVTVADLLGQITWLLSMSPLHCDMKLGDLQWLVMPALQHKQFHIFRDGEKPVGAALWACVSAEVDARMSEGSPTIYNKLSSNDWASGDRLWLIDLIAPFSSADNHQRDIMLGDLMVGIFSGRDIKTWSIEPGGLLLKPVTISAEAGLELKKRLQLLAPLAE